MQPKRIVISLLVVILALLSAGTVVSAEDSTTLDMAVEVSSSTALSDNNLCIVSEGDVVTVSVTIKSNPGISAAHFEILYDPAYLDPTNVSDGGVLNWTPTDVFDAAATETVVLKATEGRILYTVQSKSGNLTQTGKVFTCSFSAAKHGNTEVKLDMDTRDALCTKPGSGMQTIDAVNISYGGNTVMTAFPVRVHTLSSAYTSVPANCISGGMKAYACSSCTETVLISDGTPALGHTPVVVPSTAPTCVSDGLTEGTKCSVCDAVITAQLVAVEKSDAYHTVVTDPAVAPTCSAVGYTEGSHCSSCDKVIVAPTEIAASGHSYGDWVNAKNERTKTCSVCGDVLTDALAGSGNNALWIGVIVAVACVLVGAAVVVVVLVLKKKKVV